MVGVTGRNHAKIVFCQLKIGGLCHLRHTQHQYVLLYQQLGTCKSLRHTVIHTTTITHHQGAPRQPLPMRQQGVACTQQDKKGVLFNMQPAQAAPSLNLQNVMHWQHVHTAPQNRCNSTSQASANAATRWKKNRVVQPAPAPKHCRLPPHQALKPTKPLPTHVHSHESPKQPARGGMRLAACSTMLAPSCISASSASHKTPWRRLTARRSSRSRWWGCTRCPAAAPPTPPSPPTAAAHTAA